MRNNCPSVLEISLSVQSDPMRSTEDKEISSGCTVNSFHLGNGQTRETSSSRHHHRTALGKPTPSKWDDAQKWLAGLSRGDRARNTSITTKPRNSNADDTRLIQPSSHNETHYPADQQAVGKEETVVSGSLTSLQCEVQTKDIDWEEPYWQINKPVDRSSISTGSVCVRDMGTEMTPSGSQEPSRTATPIRATTPVRKSPLASGSSTPVMCQQLVNQGVGENYRSGPPTVDNNVGQASPLGVWMGNAAIGESVGDGENSSGICHAATFTENNTLQPSTKMNPLETRAMAWDEAERAKYIARYKREEVKIQAWENRETRKAEMKMKKVEAKTERLKARAQEKYSNKLASAKRIAEEKRAAAEAKMNERAVETSEKADYIRRTGHMPSYFAFKLPSRCCC